VPRTVAQLPTERNKRGTTDGWHRDSGSHFILRAHIVAFKTIDPEKQVAHGEPFVHGIEKAPDLGRRPNSDHGKVYRTHRHIRFRLFPHILDLPVLNMRILKSIYGQFTDNLWTI
jgi:hypothetical protein